MSQYQLRVYTLRGPDALAAYENIWAKHIPGMAKHRITTHGVWTVPASAAPPAVRPRFLPGRRRRAGAAGGIPVEPRIPR